MAESKEYKFSVRKYADYILDNEPYYIAENKKRLVDLMKAMLNYGGYAQKYYDMSSLYFY